MRHGRLVPFLAVPAIVTRSLVLCLVALGVGSPARAGSPMPPTGLGPGDSFQLVFVTSGTTTAVSSDIADYNRFVSAAAAAAGLDLIDGQPVTWQAIGSTATVDARNNAPQTAPVYDLLGDLITASPGGLWNTRLLFLQHPIDVTELEAPLLRGSVWTGSTDEGTGNDGLTLGSSLTLATVGDLTSEFPSWISTGFFPESQQFHVYALSSPITIPSVPEPSSLYLGGLALITLLTWWSCRNCAGSNQ
jgi:hypothetical protein